MAGRLAGLSSSLRSTLISSISLGQEFWIPADVPSRQSDYRDKVRSSRTYIVAHLAEICNGEIILKPAKLKTTPQTKRISRAYGASSTRVTGGSLCRQLFPAVIRTHLQMRVQPMVLQKV